MSVRDISEVAEASWLDDALSLVGPATGREARLQAARLELARELHDVVGSAVCMISLQAAAAAQLLPERPEQALEALSDYADQGVPTLRELQARFAPVLSGIVLSGLVGSNGGGFDRAVIATAAALHLHALVYWVSDTRPASEIVWEAQARLDAGDLSGALKSLGKLPEREAKLAELRVKEAQSRVVADQVLEGLELVARSLPTDMARRPLAAN